MFGGYERFYSKDRKLRINTENFFTGGTQSTQRLPCEVSPGGEKVLWVTPFILVRTVTNRLPGIDPLDCTFFPKGLDAVLTDLRFIQV